MDSGKLYTIKDTSFTLLNTYSGNGGAISVTGDSALLTSTSLTVIRCSFSSCVCTQLGGGVYASSMHFTQIKDSIFISCITNTYPYGGGGIMLFSITAPVISECTFVSCQVRDDGGGFEIMSCGSESMRENEVIIAYGNRMFSCSTSDSGGGCEIRENMVTLGCADSLFSSNSAIFGGGIFFWFSSTIQSHLICFCFFTGNNQNKGNDICTYEEQTVHPLLLCFTTTETKAYCYEHSGSVDYYSGNWLPQGVIKYTNLPFLF